MRAGCPFKCLLLSIAIFLGYTNYGQYTVNGSATKDNCHCYTLTPDIQTKSGSVWNNNRIDLNQPFAFTFDIFLGCNDTNGADGIAFVLQPISSSVGTTGSGMGYEGISPSVGVTLDTYQNSSPNFFDNDPAYDHIAIQMNGDVNHLSPNTLTPLTMISSSNINVEECAWHILKIAWDPNAKTLTTWFDGQLRVSATKDLITSVFGGSSLVFWGFTGATGGLANLQQFCTALNPKFYLLSGQKRCINEPVTFYDSTIAFAPIQKRYWNFGDGSAIDSVNINPVHIFSTAGDYTVVLTVIGADGCIESKTQVLRIGSKPLADFSMPTGCANTVLSLMNTSTTQIGTINKWYWDLGDGNTSDIQHPSALYSSAGSKQVRLAVQSIEGCTSDTTDHFVNIYTQPNGDFSFDNDQCQGNSVQFTDLSNASPGSLTSWSWDFGNGNTSSLQNPSRVFLMAGVFPVTLIVTSNNSCESIIMTKTISILQKPTAFFKSGPVCQSVPITFTDSSNSSVDQSWWDFGNGIISTDQNPVTLFNSPGTATIRYAVTTANGCRSDTLVKTIIVQAKPVADFKITPLVCYGVPAQFYDSSTISGGSIKSYSWTYSGVEWDTLQNPSRMFFPGSQTVGLITISSAGCISDTTYKTFYVYPEVDFTMNFGNQCKNTPVEFTATDNTGDIVQWRWTFGPGIEASTRNTMHTYSSNGTFPVQLMATDRNGCTFTSTRDIIIYGTNAYAGKDTISAAGQPITLQASGGLSYEWSPATGLSDPTNAQPLAILFSTQTYSLKASTPEGCESYDEVTIRIYDGPEIYLPNTFTPNNDGLNDVFRGIPVGIKEFKYLKIFNRWGQEIFSTTDYNKSWDGKWKGQDQSSGIFIVIANGIDFRGNVIDKKGTVMLIR